MKVSIAARRLWTGDEMLEFPILYEHDGRITHIETLPAADHARIDATHRFPDSTLVPPYVDVHVHGCAGHDVMEATPAALNSIGKFLASRGVGAYLPTTVTSTRDETLSSLSGLAREIGRLTSSSSAPLAKPLGVHLEGPFLSHAKRGVHRSSLLESPSVALFEQFWQAAEGQIKLMTIAPELPGSAELIAFATALGVRCSLGHSNATSAEAEPAVKAGACSATHTFNAMRGIDHREPGLAGFVLDQPGLFAEIICDGIHVDPAVVRIFQKAKREDRILLVTDGISATGMPDGTYMLGDMQVEVHDGRCTSDGTLAGSVLTLERAVRNFMEFTGASLSAAVSAASGNPSRLIGLSEEWGCLKVGCPANLTVLSADAIVLATFLGDRISVK